MQLEVHSLYHLESVLNNLPAEITKLKIDCHSNITDEIVANIATDFQQLE